MTFLEKIRILKVDDEGVVIRELGKLKQLRNLRISGIRTEHTKSLCSSIHEMQFLKVLEIHVDYGHEGIDFPHMSSLSTLQKLFLHGNLKKLPNWISRLQNLVKLSLNCSELTNDPLESLKDIPNLLFLAICFEAYKGETLHFKDGGFQKLKKLELKYLYKLNSIFIERGALPSLKKLGLNRIPKLRKVPSGIERLEKLQVLNIKNMPIEFEQSIASYGGQDHWMIRHVPRVQIKTTFIEIRARARRMGQVTELV
uniref:Disease resistance protein RPM1 n=1 Tax=Cajanus cajan TaxID=3821 RepID=A0A151R623_CAJCA|nr:Disease resistance protein RPM1 [Cajanus cajan]